MTDQPFTPDDVPPDTDAYIYRPVTRWVDVAETGVPVAESVLTQIRISQP